MIKKRKNIDLTLEAIRLLGYMSVREGVAFKTYIENFLENHAREIDEGAILSAMSKDTKESVTNSKNNNKK